QSWLMRDLAGLAARNRAARAVLSVDAAFIARHFEPGISRTLAWHYFDGGGRPFVLTQEQMEECQPVINLGSDLDGFVSRPVHPPPLTPQFASLVLQTYSHLDGSDGDPPAAPAAAGTRTVSRQVSFTGLATALNHGTLGTFTITYQGTLTVRVGED